MTVRQRILFLALLALSLSLNAQFGKNCEVRQFKINLLQPGLEYEMALGVNTTIDIRAEFQWGLNPFNTNIYEDIQLMPAAVGQYRYYYNFEKRQRKRRQIYGNSANYIAPTIATFLPDALALDDEPSQGVFGYAGMVTGLQRSYNSGFNFSLDVGAAYYLGSFEGGIYPVANLSIGWIFSEKRWCVGK
ncbi:hypothetical protein [Maribacter sp. 2210JD10-5]|uniref:hypothetical protein n=1 Tax=Maribacter sp. 2210JD10-5 TaxID=3386272 RepID=UPI0039BD0B10